MHSAWILWKLPINRERPISVHCCRTGGIAEWQLRVVSRQLANSFISVWCRTEYGQNLSFPEDWRRTGMPQLRTLPACLNLSSSVLRYQWDVAQFRHSAMPLTEGKGPYKREVAWSTTIIIRWNQDGTADLLISRLPGFSVY
jgi:hypothetical protein